MEDGFMWTSKSLPLMLNSEEDITVFTISEEIVIFNQKDPCAVKLLWESPGAYYESLGFPKNSPLFPFFKHVYGKLRESGDIHRLQRKWSVQPLKCKASMVKPFSVKRVISIVAAFFILVTFSLASLAFELIYNSRQ